MKDAVDPHLPFRQLISERLDGVLPRDATVRLRAHLAICPPCRMAQRAYLRDRLALRSMNPLPPPRDLWARTAAALDREIARRPSTSRRLRSDRRARRADSPALMLSALASLVLGVAVVGTQFGTSRDDLEATDDPVVALPTPFGVPTQALAFVELTPAGLAIYQTTVDRVCPPASIDCAEVSTTHRRLVAAPGERTAVSLDLHAANGRLALLTIDDMGNDTVSVVTLQRFLDPVPPFVGPLRSDGPVVRSSPVSPAVSAADRTPDDIDGTDPPASDDPPEGLPSHDGVEPSRSDHPDRPSDEPDHAPSSGASSSTSPSASAPGTGLLSSSELPAVGDPLLGSPSADIPSISPVPAALQAVLEDVRVVGAPPSWSSDGEMLAFSAMPVDASGGPDVYTWRSGDARAQQLTDDGASYFASWAGQRVVVSRPETVETAGAIRAVTVVIDPGTGLERLVEGDGGWLPAVDPSGRFAITWHGDLESEGLAVQPIHGALSMIEWRAIDPFAPTSLVPGDSTAGQGGGSLGSGAPDTGAGASASADVPAKAEAPASAEAPATVADPARAKARREAREKRWASRAAEETPNLSPAAPLDASPDTSPDTSPTTSSADSPDTTGPLVEGSPLATREPGGDGVPVEPRRDVAADPVREWQVRWSADSSAFGYWVTETPGAAWGQLAVLRVDRSSASIDEETVLLAPTLARRSFTLGDDRVAWVAPAEDRPDGELRLRTWGPRGYGSLRIREFDVSTGLPAF